MKKEIWKDVPGYEGFYQVSSKGRVRSLERDTFYSKNGKRLTRTKKTRILKQSKSPAGYPRVNLFRDAKMWRVDVHVLVALTFIGPRNGLMVNHKDRSKDNNKSENLEYVTHRENMSHAAKRPPGARKIRNKWHSYIGHKGKQIYLGSFASAEDANTAYVSALERLGIQNKYARGVANV